MCTVNCELQNRTVLLVEDNEKLNESNRRALELKGYRVLTALTLHAAREHLKGYEPDVILLDIELPDGDGVHFCGEILDSVTSHIIFLTAKTEEEDRIKGLEHGGDDYITKPFKLEEMLARVGAAMRRREKEAAKPPARTFAKGPLTLDVVAGRALMYGVDMGLKPKEFALLLALVRNEGRDVSAKELYETAWNLPANEDTRTLWQHISKLRKKFSASGDGLFSIESLYASGYRFDFHGQPKNES